MAWLSSLEAAATKPMAVCGGAVGASSPQGQFLATLISKLQVVLLQKLSLPISNSKPLCR